MAAKSGAPGGSSWTRLETHHWDGSTGLETSLVDALAGLDVDVDGVPLYEYVDVEALVTAFAPTHPDRGVGQVSFTYEGYEVRISADGTIAARPK
ncbi:HalOD1 output domain-containing protein [Halobacteriales archaeon Cl-PHB]